MNRFLALLRLLPLLLRVTSYFKPPKGQSPVSEAETNTAAPTVENGLLATAPAEAPAPVANASAVVNSVVQTVTTHPDVPQHKAADVIASILAGLYQAEPAIFAVTRSSSRTQAEVGLGVGLASVILSAFLHPGA